MGFRLDVSQKQHTASLYTTTNIIKYYSYRLPVIYTYIKKGEKGKRETERDERERERKSGKQQKTDFLRNLKRAAMPTNIP